MISRFTDTPHRRGCGLRGLHADQRGQVMVESAMVLLVLLVFLLLSPVIWLFWEVEQDAQIDAHRGAYYKATWPVRLPRVESTVPKGILEFLSKHKFPKFPEDLKKLKLDPKPPDDLKGYEKFVNEYVEGWQWNTVEYGTGFEWFKGELEISRYSAVIRPPWTWVGWPMVATQETRFRGKSSETRKVRDAYWKAYDETMDKKTVKALKLSKKPPR